MNIKFRKKVAGEPEQDFISFKALLVLVLVLIHLLKAEIDSLSLVSQKIP